MINPDQKNLVLSDFNAHEINNLPTDSKKIKEIINYLSAITALLQKHDEAIKSIVASNENVPGRLNSHSDHLNSHDQHLASHDEHLASLTKK